MDREKQERLFRSHIARSGMTMMELAEKFGCTRKTVYSKVTNPDEMKTKEAREYADTLQMTDQEILALFFGRGGVSKKEDEACDNRR